MTLPWPYREPFEQEWPVKQQRLSERLHFVLGLACGGGLVGLLWRLI